MEIRELPINPRIVEQMSKATIRNFIDAVVELATNCDDSYRRLEEQAITVLGQIEIFVSRQKGGICKEFWVKDYAEGMTKEGLERALEFAGETSGFEKGQTVRGLFGRGLKETIISLGEGEIYTIKDGLLNTVKVWWDEVKKKPLYGLKEEIRVSQERREKIGIEEGNGTFVRIDVKSEKIKIPEYNNLKQQISDHYALREINCSKNRKVTLKFHDINKGSKNEVPITFSFERSYPGSKEVFNDKVRLPEYDDSVKVKIFKSPVPLDWQCRSPFNKAGILIKTEACILDNQLFMFEKDPAAFYFWGEADCKGMAERIRKGETGIINLNRAGIEWQHEYCKVLEGEIEKNLAPLIEEKRKELQKGDEKEVSESTRKMLNKLCEQLNRFAKEEFEELPSIVEPSEKIEVLIILPGYANIEVDKPRTLSVYAPNEMVEMAGIRVSIESNNNNIQTLSSHVNLGKHSKYPDLHYGFFKIIGRVMNEEGKIVCRLGEEEAVARVKVGEQKKKQKGKLKGKKRGFISNIQPDETPNPIQRVEYRRGLGEIRIYVKFPAVAKYLDVGLKGAETEQGRVILAELVGEAFCRELARQSLDTQKNPTFPGSDIDIFNSAVNELQKKYLHQIHDAITTWRFG